MTDTQLKLLMEVAGILKADQQNMGNYDTAHKLQVLLSDLWLEKNEVQRG